MEKEILEEAAHKMLNDYGIKSMGQSIGVLEVKKLMVKMAKWQEERMYSEKDMECAFKSSSLTNVLDVYDSFEEFITQFKKK